MRVLVVESEPAAAGDVVNVLEAAGHEVVRCHEEGLPAFPCNGILRGSCPVDANAVDVAVTARSHVHPTPTPLEDGMTCAIRHEVPLVLVGMGALNPFERFGTREVRDAGSVVTACEQAHLERVRYTSALVSEVVRRVCELFGQESAGMSVETTVDGGRIVATVALPYAAHRYDTALHASIRDELCRLVPWARSVEISLHADARG